MLAIPSLDPIEVAFPAHALRWMPAMEDIPAGFRRPDNEWVRIADYWFKNGLADGVAFVPRDGVNAEAAYKAVMATLRSYAAPHQHKIAAAAFMLSEWFDEVRGWAKT